MRIITISRECGSGGRELGKRMADILAIDYYDSEIINAVSEKYKLDADYVEMKLENHGWRAVPITYKRSFSESAVMQSSQTRLLLEQKKVIESIADLGKDFVIVGRNADVLLAKYEPFNIFVCADIDSKVRRCVERAGEGESLSKKEIMQNIRRIDRNRSDTRIVVTGTAWGDRVNYHLVVNTSNWEIKRLAPVVCDFVNNWFGRKK